MPHTERHLQSHAMLLTTAMVWGLSFVFQKQAVDAGLPPLLFNAVRFAVGGLVLLPLVAWLRARPGTAALAKPRGDNVFALLVGGGLMGTVLTMGAAFQQAGMEDAATTAGKAGFITGLYVVLVPVFGVVIGRGTHWGAWLGVAFALVGLPLLTIDRSADQLALGRGDALVLISAACWAGHILLIDHFTARHDALALSVIQFLVCAALSTVVGLALGERLTPQALSAGWTAIAYCGVVSVAIAYTLQVVAQKNAHPTAAALILSTEVVFATLGGMLFLDETMPLRGYFGAALMLTGMLISQVAGPTHHEPAGGIGLDEPPRDL